MKRRKSKKSTFFIFSLVVFVVGVFISGLFIIFKLTQTARAIFPNMQNQKTITITQTLSNLTTKATDESHLQGYEDGRINILLLGIAGKSSEKKGELLTDTIMLASIDTKNHRAALMSLPRDLLVETKNGINKINTFYGIGMRENRSAHKIVEAVEIVTDQEVHYYFVMDFDGFEKIVDTLNGINVSVPRTIDDPLYPGPGYSYEPFYIEKGFHSLDGKTALKYVRSRYDDPESDFGRAKRQQQVLRALRNKALSIGTLSNPFTLVALLDTLGSHVTTNISTSEIRAVGSLIKKVDTQNMTTVVIDAWKPESLLRSVFKKTPVGNLAGLTPRSGDWEEIAQYAENIFTLEKITLRRDAITAEMPSLTIINASGQDRVGNRIKTLLAGTGFTNITVKNAKKSDTRNTTILLDRTASQKPFALDELTKRIKPINTTKLPEEYAIYIPKNNLKTNKDSNKNQKVKKISQENEDAATIDFVLILGEDLIKKHAYEPATRESVEKDYKLLPPKK